MDQLFASLAISSVHLVGKAAFGMATSIAIKKVTNLVSNTLSSASVKQTKHLSKLQLKVCLKYH